MLKSFIFNKIHLNNLVYNTCWEDPRCDRQVMQFDEQSKIVVLTSAGCNALDYLLDFPESVDCVDMNPRQNALLELKIALFNTASHDELFGFFGVGKHHQAREIYYDLLAPQLSGFSAEYWERRIHIFEGKGVRDTFYYHGTSGIVAFFLKKSITMRPKLRKEVEHFFESSNMEEQRERYLRLEPQLLNSVISWFLDRHAVQSLLGVPEAQQELARKNYQNGMIDYFKESFRRVFMELPVSDNYFWSLYFFGNYSMESCPNYLKKDFFEKIKGQTNKISTFTGTLSKFLEEKPQAYSHFILLDHQDWMAKNALPELREEWDLILKNAQPNAKVLMRSAAKEIDFIPEFAKDRLRFNHEKANYSQRNDRVGTYSGIVVAEIMA